MANKNRSTLKQYFRQGALPTEDHFRDLIDSCLNTIDEGFDKSAENGFEISLTGEYDRLISFFRNAAENEAVWSIHYDRDTDQLLVRKSDAKAKTPAAITFGPDGKIGINQEAPSYELDVKGTIAAEGRIGANPRNQRTVPADGKWHNITDELRGCQAFEVMAGAGNKGTGRYALMNAIAMNTFNPRGYLFNFLNLKKKIKVHQAYYLSRIYRIKLRWNGKGEKYQLQIRSNCDYGERVRIRYFLTKLWFDEDMSESWKYPIEPSLGDMQLKEK